MIPLEDRKNKIVAQGWATEEGQPGPKDPLAEEILSQTRDPLHLSLAVAAGMPVAKAIAQVPINFHGLEHSEISGPVELLAGDRKAYGIRMGRTVHPIPFIQPRLKARMASAELGKGKMVQDASGIRLTSIELDGQLVDLDRDGHDVSMGFDL